MVDPNSISQTSRDQLLKWFDTHQRNLPWRESKDPYLIWLSEIILQQTRIEQGTSYFHAFKDQFANIHALANAEEDEVLKLWQGLGYYSRARNLHATAKTVAFELNGKFPETHESLLRLKGVGPYTAAAIGSIAFDLPVAAIDGNVIRVITRLFNIQESVDATPTKKSIHALANGIIRHDRPGDWNQAMMELGSLICTPTKPNCTECPFKNDCAGLRLGTKDTIPFKERKTKTKNRHFHFIVLSDKEGTYIEKRIGNDIWKGMYQFPLIETDKPTEMSSADIEAHIKTPIVLHRVNQAKKHILSHQIIFATFYHAQPVNAVKQNWLSIEWGDFDQYALPRLIDRYLESYNFDGRLKR